MLELIVTMAILALLSAIAIPNFSTWFGSAKYRGGTLTLASTLRLSRETAVSANVESRVELDVDGKRYRLSNGNMPSGSTAWTAGPWEDLDPAVNWNTGTACGGTADLNIMFMPNGSSGGGTVCIKDLAGADRFKVVVNSISGRVQVE